MRIVLLLLMTVMISVSNGQSEENAAAVGQSPQVSLVFNQDEFGDRFSVLFYSDDNYDYYVIDLTKLEDRFARVYFMNLTYADSRIVNLDADISKDQTWFKSYYTYNEEQVTCLFKDLKEKTEGTLKGMTADERSAWMAQFDKFKNNTDNE